MFEGIIETYNWLGPSFNDVRIIKTDIPIDSETKHRRYAVSVRKRTHHPRLATNLVRSKLIFSPAGNQAAW
jgi:hypothetical protein